MNEAIAWTELLAGVDWPDRDAGKAAEARWGTVAKPEGSLGRLESLGAWWCATRGMCPAPPPERAVLIIFAADHGVASVARTSAYPPEVTAQMVRAFLHGRAAANALARQIGARVRVVDIGVDADPAYADDLDPDVARHRVRRGSGSIDREDALTAEETALAISAGAQIVDEEVDAGADLLILGDMGIGNTTIGAVISGLLSPAEVTAVVGRGTGIDDATWMRKAAAVRDAMARGRPDKGSPVDLLARVGGADLAAMTGALLRAAGRRTPVILDGTLPTAAALVAHRAAFKSRDWWQAGHRSTEPAQRAALARLDLEPLLDLELRLGEGTGALLAVPLLASAAAALAEMGTFADLGVSGPDGAPDSDRDGEPGPRPVGGAAPLGDPE